MDSIEKNFLPLTYENAISDLKKKNAVIKRLYSENIESKTMVLPTVIHDSEKLNALQSENEKFRDKIISIQSDLRAQ